MERVAKRSWSTIDLQKLGEIWQRKISQPRDFRESAKEEELPEDWRDMKGKKRKFLE